MQHITPVTTKCEAFYLVLPQCRAVLSFQANTPCRAVLRASTATFVVRRAGTAWPLVRHATAIL